MRRPLVFFPIVLAGVLCDLCSKKVVFDWLDETRDYPLIRDVLQFHLAANEGAAFSVLKQHPAILLLITVAMLAMLTLYYLRVWRGAHGLLLAALALLMIGAAGNLYDRVRFHYVRDFIDFMPELPLIGHWAVFNLADVCITVGVGLYAIYALFHDKPAVKNEASSV